MRGWGSRLNKHGAGLSNPPRVKNPTDNSFLSSLKSTQVDETKINKRREQDKMIKPAGQLTIKASVLKFIEATALHKAAKNENLPTAYRGVWLDGAGNLFSTNGFKIAIARQQYEVTPELENPVLIQAASRLPRVTRRQYENAATATIDFDANLIHWPGNKVILFTVVDASMPNYHAVLPPHHERLQGHQIPIDAFSLVESLKHWPGGEEEATAAMNNYSGWFKQANQQDNGHAFLVIDDGLIQYVQSGLRSVRMIRPNDHRFESYNPGILGSM